MVDRYGGFGVADCIICGIEGPTGRAGDGQQQDCKRCGPYVISLTARAMIGSRLEDDPLAWARASHAIRRRTSRENWLRIASHDVDQLTSARLPGVEVQLQSLLEWLAERSGEDAFARVPLDPDDMGGFVGTTSPDAVGALLAHAVRQGFVDCGDDRMLMLTPEGWAARAARVAATATREDPAEMVSVPEQAQCPGCGGIRACDIVAQHQEQIDGGDGMTSAWVSVRTLRCRGCGTLHVVREDSFSEDEDHVQDPRTGEWTTIPVIRTTRWPTPARRARPTWLATLADETARSLGEEIHAALAADLLTLAAMGVRALLDRTFELAGADAGADFGAKLRQLRERGVLGERELETLRVVTDAGSAAGHRGWRPEPDELDTILDVAEGLLHSVAVQPARTERLRVAVPPRPQRPGRP